MKPSRWLSPEAKKVFKRLAPEMQSRGLLEEVYREAFESLCQCWARYQESTELVNREGTVIDGYRGSKVKHPALQIARDSLNQFIKWSREFGLTPDAMSKMDVPKPKVLSLREKAKNLGMGYTHAERARMRADQGHPLSVDEC